MTELKPCPFCGSDRIRVYTGLEHYTVECYSCQTHGPVKAISNEAEERWNRRVAYWINAEERLPEEGVDVLTFHDGVFDIAHCENGELYFSKPVHVITGDIYWRELPTPPETNDK